MTIYADTSFLVSYLYPGDLCHRKARQYFGQHAAEAWVTTSWSQFETTNTLRQLCLQQGGPGKLVIESIRLLFKHWHKRGPFQHEDIDFEEALIDCRQMSTAFGSALRMRSADALHVAILEQISPDAFVTRDADQFSLAQARGFNCHLVG